MYPINTYQRYSSSVENMYNLTYIDSVPSKQLTSEINMHIPVSGTEKRTPRLSRKNVARIIEAACENGFSGFGGDCGEAALAINQVLFDGHGQVVGVFNKALYDHGHYIGHFAVEYNGIFWDADATPKSFDEIESWGMLDTQDIYYVEMASKHGIEWNDNTASETTAWAFHTDEEVTQHMKCGKLEDFIAALNTARQNQK